MITEENKLTKKQSELLDYIIKEMQQHGYPPTIRELCDKLSVSSSGTIHARLKALERKGYIRRDPTKPRAIELLKTENKTKLNVVRMEQDHNKRRMIILTDGHREYTVLAETMRSCLNAY